MCATAFAFFHIVHTQSEMPDQSFGVVSWKTPPSTNYPIILFTEKVSFTMGDVSNARYLSQLR